jgi:uncharacterized protein YecE (DUF72 family)
MRFFVGTSGFSYKEWKGEFYPEKLPQKAMLGYYAQHFSTVELNNTFYRMPTASVVESWAAQVPESFRFVLKAPRTITHFKRLVDVEKETQGFLDAASVLQARRGPVLFQLPPNLKKDLARLEHFLSVLGDHKPAAFEFRHDSWLIDEVFDLLRARSCALCAADTEESPLTDFVSTADWGYIRLRAEGYSDDELKHWIERLRSKNLREAYVFFRHEETGTGPKLATRFLDMI